MTGYRIKEVARRSGFTSAALRYYEELGILPVAARTASGYRTYDDGTFDRLAFIARAKQLGCTLEEIADLTAAWDGGRCGPIQDRLRALVTEKLSVTEQRLAALRALSSDLEAAAAQLERHRPDGACDDSCGCIAGEKATPDPSAGVAITCTLAPASLVGRVEEWAALLACATHRVAIGDGVRVELALGAPLDELARLVAAEQRCCQFFGFAITVDSRGVALEITAPPEALPIVHSLFGAPDRASGDVTDQRST